VADAGEVGAHLPDSCLIWSDAGLAAGLDYLEGRLEGVEGVDGILEAAVSALQVEASSGGEGTDAICPGAGGHRAGQRDAQVVRSERERDGVGSPKHMMHQGSGVTG
jgi:hypothetical protein